MGSCLNSAKNERDHTICIESTNSYYRKEQETRNKILTNGYLKQNGANHSKIVDVVYSYYHMKHLWDLSKVPDDTILKIDGNVVTRISPDMVHKYCAFTVNTVSVGEVESFCIHYVAAVLEGGFYVGIVEESKCKDMSLSAQPWIDDGGFGFWDIGMKIHDFQRWSNSYMNDEIDDDHEWSVKYGEQFHVNDVITVIVNLANNYNSLSFMKNGKNLGKAYNIKPTKYKIFVCFSDDGTTIKLL